MLLYLHNATKTCKDGYRNTFAWAEQDITGPGVRDQGAGVSLLRASVLQSLRTLELRSHRATEVGDQRSAGKTRRYGEGVTRRRGETNQLAAVSRQFSYPLLVICYCEDLFPCLP